MDLILGKGYTCKFVRKLYTEKKLEQQIRGMCFCGAYMLEGDINRISKFLYLLFLYLLVTMILNIHDVKTNKCQLRNGYENSLQIHNEYS